MTAPNESLDARLNSMAKELTRLKTQVDDLSARFGAREAGSSQTERTALSEPEHATVQGPPGPAAGPGGAEPGFVWSWIGRSSLLPRVAAICFILVIALLLRTLTDNGTLARSTGSLLGMFYAAALIAWGWRLLSRQSRLGFVFPICGAVLMFFILLESHIHFKSVSSLTVYAVLAVTMLALHEMGMRYQLPSLNCVGVLGATFFAIVIDFPNPYFPYLMPLLLVANIVADRASSRQPLCEGTRWLVFGVTMLFWLLWAFKLRVPLGRGQEVAAGLAYAWFLPGVFLFALSYMALVTRRILLQGKTDLFDLLLPTLNVLWAFGVAFLALASKPHLMQTLGVAGIILALIHFTVAAIIFKKELGAAAGICAFTFAGATLLLMAAPPAFGNTMAALPVWSGVALCLVLMSKACEIGGIRLASYLLQAAACGAGVASGSFSIQTPTPFYGMTMAGVLLVISAAQYRWSRQHPIACSAGFFATVDPKDRAALVLLAAALINGYCALRLAGFMLLGNVLSGNIANAFTGMQSVLINLGAIGLMIFGLIKADKELLGAAVAVTILGGVKVFGVDLFEAHGVPLLLSVSSFGAVTAAGSIVLSRWQRARDSLQVTE